MIKKSIYLVITLFVILIIGILPLTNLPVSASSRGIIRSQTENAKIVSVVGGRVIETKLEKNNHSYFLSNSLKNVNCSFNKSICSSFSIKRFSYCSINFSENSFTMICAEFAKPPLLN